ncbi:thiamine phosphate synthase [Alteriqipengyuania sp.]|uniref:thiamine phosphate synthase n=1 Tax=Alteriqipengyuania sp. TaxID=2800692 RepID=UPI0035137781
MLIHPLPDLWLLSDERNDATLESALERLPDRSAFVFRHYHLAADDRRERYKMLRSICRSKNHLLILSGDPDCATEWAADGVYGAPGIMENAAPLLHIATAHDEQEIAAAEATGADAIMLSPIFPTRSHPDAPALGPERFHALADSTPIPVIALGGMSAKRARELGVARWAAIDGLS